MHVHGLEIRVSAAGFFFPRSERTSQQCNHEHLETRTPTLTKHIMHRRSGTTNSGRQTIQQRDGEKFSRGAPQQTTPPLSPLSPSTGADAAERAFADAKESKNCRDWTNDRQPQQRGGGPATHPLPPSWFIFFSDNDAHTKSPHDPAPLRNYTTTRAELPPTPH